MNTNIQLNYSENLIRLAVFRFWWRTVGIGSYVVLAILSGYFGYLLFSNQSGWQVGALGAFLLLSFSFIGFIYLVHYTRTMRKFRAMASPEADFEISEREFSFSSGLGSSTLRWSGIAEVWVFKNMWLFLFSKAQFSTIPLCSISEEERAYILSRIEAAGGKIS